MVCFQPVEQVVKLPVSKVRLSLFQRSRDSDHVIFLTNPSWY